MKIQDYQTIKAMELRIFKLKKYSDIARQLNTTEAEARRLIKRGWDIFRLRLALHSRRRDKNE